MDISECYKLQGAQSYGDSHFCQVSLRKPYQVRLVKTGEKSSGASGKGRWKVAILKYTQ